MKTYKNWKERENWQVRPRQKSKAELAKKTATGA